MSKNLLLINSSARDDEATSYQLLELLSTQFEKANITDRNLNQSELPLLDSSWIDANFTPSEERSEAHKKTLALSDSYIKELMQADIIAIGVPVYNFGVPAALKAYIDLICRARLTFKYTENGPVGLLENKSAYLVVTSGGVPIDSPVDFVTPYLKQVLNFIGISDITVIDSTQLNADKDGSKLAAAKQIIASL